VPRKVFDEVKGFDEVYVQIFEESDFGWKILEAGYDEIVLTSARTEHHGFLEPGCVPELRQLGIEKPYRTYCFARNRLRFAKKHFSILQTLSVTFIFAPLSCCYYALVAMRNKRIDIAWAYFRGTMVGIWKVLTFSKK
jgi:GT2 family glycosyltransferase